MFLSRERIIEFVEREGLGPWREKKERGDINICSPFEREDKFRCGFNYKRRGEGIEGCIWNDWKANRGGKNFFGFIMELKDFEHIGAAKQYYMKNYLLGQQGLSEALSIEERVEDEAEDVLELPSNARRITSDDSEYVDYLHSRGFTNEDIDRERVFVDTSSRRVVFPVYENEKLVFWTGRLIDKDDTKLRWLSCKHTGTPVWGTSSCMNYAFVCEGIFDAAVVKGGRAILGRALRPKVLAKIVAENPRNIVVVMDDDNDGREAQEEIADWFASQEGMKNRVFVVDWRPGDDKDLSAIAAKKMCKLDSDSDFMSRVVPWNAQNRLLIQTKRTWYYDVESNDGGHKIVTRNGRIIKVDSLLPKWLVGKLLRDTEKFWAMLEAKLIRTR